MNEPSSAAQSQALEHNFKLLSNMLDCWLPALQAGQLVAGSLGASPAATLLRYHWGLGLRSLQNGEILTTAGDSSDPHEGAYTWWTYVREHGLAHRENRKPHGYQVNLPSWLTNLPWPAWLLFEIDQAFDEAYPFATLDEAAVEAMLSPEITVYRLQMVLHLLQSNFPLTLGQYDQLDARLTACA